MAKHGGHGKHEIMRVNTKVAAKEGKKGGKKSFGK